MSVVTIIDTTRFLIQRDLSTSYAAHFGGWMWGVFSGLFVLRHSLGSKLRLHEVRAISLSNEIIRNATKANNALQVLRSACV